MKLRWTRPALADLAALSAYIAREDPLAARRMVSRIRDVVQRLAEYPQMGKSGRVPETRELMLAQSPYCVVYAVMPDSVEIIAVLHTARQWQND